MSKIITYSYEYCTVTKTPREHGPGDWFSVQFMDDDSTVWETVELDDLIKFSRALNRIITQIKREAS